MEGHEAPITCFTYVDEMLISGSADGAMKVWNPESGEFLFDLPELGVERKAKKLTLHDRRVGFMIFLFIFIYI
jgi:WD40 repeat protein